MPRYEKEARQPLLHGDDAEDSGEDSIELPELSQETTDREADKDYASEQDPSFRQAGSGNGLPFRETSIVPRKPATSAIMFMLGAQIFSASMNVSVRLVENHLHPPLVCLSCWNRSARMHDERLTR